MGRAFRIRKILSKLSPLMGPATWQVPGAAAGALEAGPPGRLPTGGQNTWTCMPLLQALPAPCKLLKHQWAG